MKQQTNKWLTIIIIIAVVASFFVIANRIDAESNHQTIQVAIRYDDVVKITEEMALSFEEVLIAFREIGVTTLMVREHDSLYEQTGIGFELLPLEQAASLGYVISPEVKLFDRKTPESIEKLVDSINKIPNLNTIYFEDKEIPGYEHEAMTTLVSEQGIGFIEFYSDTQKGFHTLVGAAEEKSNYYPVVRMFTDEKVENISTPNRVIRHELALTERGIRVFSFVLEEDKSSKEGYEALLNDIKHFIQRAEEKGYELGVTDMMYPQNQTPIVVLFMIGLGTIAGTILLAKKFIGDKLGYLMGILMAGAYGIGLIISSNLALQGMALLTALVFPIYSVITETSVIELSQYGKAIRKFIKLCSITLIGALIMVGLLSSPPYMQGILGFRGVKIAHSLPILGVVVLFIYKNSESIKAQIKTLLKIKLKYKLILVSIFIIGTGIVGVVYITRTGNGEISALEQTVRMGLDQLLGIRPRTKEFLIGHPLLLFILYFGVKGLYLPALMLGVIGQVSLMNTYAHIHTPLIVSLIRSVYGIIIGIVIGVVLIESVKFIVKVINKWIIK